MCLEKKITIILGGMYTKRMITGLSETRHYSCRNKRNGKEE